MRCALLILVVLIAGCSGFKEQEADSGTPDLLLSEGTITDKGPITDGSLHDLPESDSPWSDGLLHDGPATDSAPPDISLPPKDTAVGDGTITPNKPCRSIPLPCKDNMPANVIEVPTEMSLQAAFQAAQSGDTVQVKGLQLVSGWFIPAYVTLRGCSGAKLLGAIAFSGSGGTVEGFEVSGQIVANQTGSYVIRHNKFVAEATSGQAGVSARSVDALVSASVTAIVEANLFDGRTYGLEALTKYDTMTHAVDISIRNNIFNNVTYPVTLSEGGLVGKIDAVLQNNTFYGFKTAIMLYSVSSKTVSTGDLFSDGDLAVSSTSAYEVNYNFTWKVKQAYTTPPLSGTFATGDPAFVNAVGGDFRLTATSAVIDKIPASVQVPSEDYQGCPRPAAPLGGQAKSDVGAIEAQP